MSHASLSKLCYESHFITPTGFTELARALTDRTLLAQAPEMQAGMDPECKFDWVDDYVVQRKKAMVDGAGIAHVYINGAVYTGLSEWQRKMGVTDMQEVRKEIKELPSSVAGVLFHINSPGGSVIGTRELAEAFADISVPKVVHTETMLASSAYFIAAPANYIVASPSAMVGSIGVYIPWNDYEKFHEAQGLKWNPVISSGSDLKAIGAGPSLTDAQREFLQGDVDRSLALFKDWVGIYRSVSDDYMRGQAVRGEEAFRANLVDTLGSEEDAYNLLLRQL